MTVDHAAFLAQIAAAPDDVGPFLAYADALQTAGDPRGDLIAIQHALERAQTSAAACELRMREAALLDANAADWLGGLADEHRSLLQIRWKRGFIHAARVDLDASGAALAALLELPCVRSTLAELRLGPRCVTDERPVGEPFLALLCERWPAGLHRLFLYDGDPNHMWTVPALSTGLLDGRPLDTLVVQAANVDLGWTAPLPSLRRLELHAPHFDPTRLQFSTPWTALEHLVLACQDPRDLARGASLADMPALRTLGLVGTAHTERVCAALATSRVVDRLEALDLSGGTLTDAGARVLAAAAPRTLRRLDISRNLLSKNAVAGLVAAFPGTDVVAVGQRRGIRPFTDPEELLDRAERLDKSLEAILDADGDPVRRYRAARAKIAAAHPSWGDDELLRMLHRLPAVERRAAATELAVEWEARLAPILHTRADDICSTIGLACDELAELHAAEAWHWRAVVASRWTRSARDEINGLANVATLRMRRGDGAAAAILLDRVATFYRDKGNKALEGWALRQQGNCELVQSQFAKAEVFYRRALELLRETKSKIDEAAVLSELAGVLWSRQDFEGAAELIRDSIAMRDPEELVTASAYYNLGALLNGMCRLDEARAAGERSLAIFRKRGHRHGEGQALSLLGELAQRRNDHQTALELLDAALTSHREVGVLRELGIALGNLSRVHLDLGNYDAARECLHEAVEVDRECNNKYNEGLAILGLADAELGDGDLDAAAILAEQAIAPLQAIANYPAIAACKLHRGYAFHLKGDHAEAERLYKAAIVDAERGNYPELIGWTALWMAALAAPRDRDAALDHLAVADGHLRDSIQGSEAYAVTTVVVARLTGSDPDCPMPHMVGLTSRLLARLAD